VKKKKLSIVGTALVVACLFGACGNQSEAVSEKKLVADVIEPETVATEELAIDEATAPETIEVEEEVVELSDSPLVGRWETSEWLGFGDDFVPDFDIQFREFNADGTGTSNASGRQIINITWTILAGDILEITNPANDYVANWDYTITDDTLTLYKDSGGPLLTFERAAG